MSNLVPEGWESKQLIECSFNGISNGVFCDPKNVGSGYKLINVYDMYQGYGVNVNLTRRLQLTEKEFLNNKVKYGDVFFTRSSLKLEGIAYCNINLSHDDDITYDGHLMKIRPNTELVNAEYLARYCLSDFARTYFMSTAKHSTMTTIAQADIAPLQVLLPPLPEQQKIAQILTSVDEVIEKTQAQIDKLKDLKTAMMQELLTKGVCDEKGKRHVEFKDSPVGRIPVAWEVVEISKLCSDVVDCVNKTAPVVDYKTQYKMIRTTNVRHGRVDTENVRNVTKETYESWTRRLRPENGDLIFTREAPVGECGVLEDSRGVFLGQRTMMYRANEQLTSSKFLMYSLTSNYGKQQLEDFSGGSTVAHMRVPDCSKILIKTPPIEEQNKIVIAINSIDDSIQKKEIKLAAINSTKKALMQDLLTGKVRVNTELSNSSLAVG
jgi:type I restriction enzyme S subunit